MAVNVKQCKSSGWLILLMLMIFALNLKVWEKPGTIFVNAAGIYLLKVNNRNTKTRCEMCSKLTTKALERRHWRRSGVFNVNFKHISHFVLVFLSLIWTCNYQLTKDFMTKWFYKKRW